MIGKEYKQQELPATKDTRTKAEKAQTAFEWFIALHQAGRDERAIEQFNKGLELLREHNEETGN